MKCIVLTDDSFIGPWMINIVISGRNGKCHMLSNGHHLLLTLLDLVFFGGEHVGDRLHVDVTFLLRCRHTLLLKLVHCVLSGVMLGLHHFLEDLLVCNWSQRDLMVDRVVVFLRVGEHF